MRYRRSCESGCNKPDRECPEYTPDFIRFAESYGAKGIRVTKAEDIKPAFESAQKNEEVPTVIEFIIDREANVMPIVPPGNPLSDMVISLAADCACTSRHKAHGHNKMLVEVIVESEEV